MDLDIEIDGWPGPTDWADLAEAAREAAEKVAPELANQRLSASVLFTVDEEVQALNREWRMKDAATNVLSFPAFPTRIGDTLPPMLGDIILAAETVAKEAELEGKPLDHHITHLVIHGLLHLLGHDHEDEAEAERMEALERAALARLAIPDPYA